MQVLNLAGFYAEGYQFLVLIMNVLSSTKRQANAMKSFLVTSVNILRNFSLKGGFDDSAHVQATTLIIQFDCL